MAPRVTSEPYCGPLQGGTRVRIRIDHVAERWTRDTSLVVVFSTRLRRMPVRARLEACEVDHAVCSVATPHWGKQEHVSLELHVNKVEAGAAAFIFYAQPCITFARPHYLRASGISTVTLKGTDLPSAAGVTIRTGPNTCETLKLDATTRVRMLSSATHEELHRDLRPTMGEAALTVEIGNVAMTGGAYFEVSLNGVDYDSCFRKWCCVCACVCVCVCVRACVCACVFAGSCDSTA